MEGTPRQTGSYDPGPEFPNTSQPAYVAPSSSLQPSRKGPSSDADDENVQADPQLPPGLPHGGPPDDPSDSDHGHQGRCETKNRKKSGGRSRRRRRRDPSSSPSSPSSRFEFSSESSFATCARRELRKSQSSCNKAKESDRVIIPTFPDPENFRN